MDFYFDSQKEKYKRPFGAVHPGTEVSMMIYAPTECSGVSLKAASSKGMETVIPMERTEGVFFRAVLKVPDDPCLVLYYFILSLEDGSTYYYGNKEDALGGEGRIYVEDPVPYQITVYEDSHVPEWYKNAVVYQIFPDRFANEKFEKTEYPEDWYELPFYDRGADGSIKWKFYDGTLKGVEEKLPYLKSLGVTCIYFNPIFKARTNHRYDTYDYFVIDERFGSDEDFDSFIASAKKYGIRVILDGVFNHSGRDSRYVTEHPDWYSGEYWWGVQDLPEYDDQNREFRDFICGENGVIRYWIRRGISGWRLDVVDELPDDFVREIRAAAKAEDPEAVIIGEVWEDASNKFSHDEHREYFFGSELDGVMNYPFRELFLDFAMFRCSAKDAMRRLMSLAENYPDENIKASFNLIDSHDRERALTLLGGQEHSWYALKRLKYGLALQYAAPGVPCIYYGDEAEMYGGKDPENRGAYPWGRENTELIDWYRLLGQIYRDHPVMAKGNMIPLDFGDEMLAFLLEGDEKILVLINRNDNSQSYEYEFGGSYALELCCSKELLCENGTVKGEIEGLSANYILLMDEKPEALKLERGAGILCHITSIPGGKLGQGAKDFVDFIASAGFKYWQMLPINPVGMGDSPYMSPDVFGIDEKLGTFEELAELKRYANSKGVKLIGDLPIYVAPEGEDVRRDPLAFQSGRHAGCPPDYFSPDGQDWGNPLYDWDYIKSTGYEWWIRRISKALEYFDYVRIDHFRGFAAYYSIPNGGSPKNGYWIPGPGIDMFNAIKNALSKDGAPLPIIAEDLGFLDAQVYNLIKFTGFPGMNVYQTDRETMERQTPAERRHRIYYPGTHDSDTLVGWYMEQGMDIEEARSASGETIEKLYGSEAGWVIVTLQDMLGLDSSARMNIPGIAEGNWQWKADPGSLTEELAEKYRKLAEKYCR